MAVRRKQTLSGFHAVEEYLKTHGRAEELLMCVSNKRTAALAARAAELGIPVRRVSRDELVREAGPKTRDVALVVARRSAGEGAPGKESGQRSLSALVERTESRSDALVLLLDGITDPQNLGAILRSAEQFGADAVLLPKRRTAGMEGQVARAAAGATAHLTVIEAVNLADAVSMLQAHGYWVYAADAAGTPASALDLSGKIGLILGSEGRGVRRLVRDRCDGLISIPTRGNLDSLNVSVAAGILLYEIRRGSRSGRNV